MNKSLKWFLVPVLCAAAALILLLGSHYLGLGKQLKEQKALLEESQNAWKTTAEEKEKLQDDLKELKDQLRDDSLTLTESQDRIVSLNDEIDQLNSDIASLKQQLGLSD